MTSNYMVFINGTSLCTATEKRHTHTKRNRRQKKYILRQNNKMKQIVQNTWMSLNHES